MRKPRPRGERNTCNRITVLCAAPMGDEAPFCKLFYGRDGVSLGRMDAKVEGRVTDATDQQRQLRAGDSRWPPGGLHGSVS